eukprot:3179173-Pleurochrysis_carterae.AAC.1
MSWISGGCRIKVRNFFWTAFCEAEVSHSDVGIVGKIRQTAFVSARRGVMNRRMDEDLFDSMS